MHCVVTAGPTYEPLDEVRRLTNFSTGRLGTGLANFLTRQGHRVTLLLGQQATWAGERRADRVATFTTTHDLRNHLRVLAGGPVDAVFHAAAVSDFKFGKVWWQSPEGQQSEITSAKISTREGALLAELLPTPKIIASLRDWFPTARLVGWKFEVEGDHSTAIHGAEKQLAESRTDACVVNGRAYGEGYGLVTCPGQLAHLPDAAALFAALEGLLPAD
jgi:phosphopantothenoylcysteine decarboxylase/phosphopantothenate--cysteine ligase